jgi:NAD(P)-dependent dehydrogenase (short-subunit alcohol dehydrogenase family)
MPGRLEGKVAFITGAARGQGRAHAVAMAKEGADIIAIDICRQIESNPYPLATPDDLAETERAVKELGRRVVARIADVRERHELRDAVEAGLADLGKIDIVVANAGILPMAMGRPHDAMSFVDASDVDLLGVMNTVAVTVPHLADGSSIIVTGSTAGMIRGTTDNPNMGPGGAGYGWSKRVVMDEPTQKAATSSMSGRMRSRRAVLDPRPCPSSPSSSSETCSTARSSHPISRRSWGGWVTSGPTVQLFPGVPNQPP